MNKFFYFMFSVILFVASSASADFRIDKIQQLDNGVTYIINDVRRDSCPYNIFLFPGEQHLTLNLGEHLKIIEAQRIYYVFSFLVILETESGERVSGIMESCRGILDERQFDAYDVEGQEVPTKSTLYQALQNVNAEGLVARNLGDGRVYHVHNIGDLGFPLSVSKDDLLKLDESSENLTTGQKSGYGLYTSIIDYKNLCLYYSLEEILYEVEYLKLLPSVKFVLPGAKFEE